MTRNVLPLAYIELSKNNIAHNMRQFRTLAHKGTMLVSVLKADAYGHGLKEMAHLLERHADYFQVNSIEELEELRKVSKKKTLLLGYVQARDIARAMRLGCIMAGFSLEHIRSINSAAKRAGMKQEIHIPIDAHLGREGFLFSGLPKLFNALKTMSNIKISGMYAHFANIEDTADFSHAEKQIGTYQAALGLARENGFKNLMTHISATSGLLMHEKSKGIHPLVRIGIGTYGLWPSEHLQKKSTLSLRPVMSWKTKVAQVKTLAKGETVGYGLTYRTKRETKVAVIPQGYSNGLDRRLSNDGAVLIGGTRCAILGRVMMNMTVVDVNHLKRIKAEDEVVIIGRQGREEITAEEVAERIGTIHYEVVTRISPLLPRIVK